MPKGLIVYFSLEGTTARVSESIAKGLIAQGLQVEVCRLKDKKPGDVTGYDLFGIGSPVYACRIPFNVYDYVRALPPLKNIPAFSFNLYGTYPADAGRQLQKLLAKKGARDIGYFACRGAEYNLGYLMKGYLFSPDNPTKEELTQAEAFGREIAARVSGKPYTPTETFHSPPFVYRMERMMCDRWVVENLVTRTFKVKTGLCNSCGLCIKLCPDANIQADNEGRPRWGKNCLCCLTCEMKCPRDAITSLADKLGPVWGYNVRHMSADKTLQFVKVRHQHGRTERL
jgi:flavodoxin/Pyruvate/2-oxoacid:ferredoxin oxidoreductase delta subunit